MKHGVAIALCLVGMLTTGIAAAADDRDAASSINHAFATELGTGIYDIGGRSIFIVSWTPAWDVLTPKDGRPGIRLIAPMSVGSFDFMPDDAFEGELPSRIDSYSIMPGVEFYLPLREDWTLTTWLRAGASFAEGVTDGALYGAGARVGRTETRGKTDFTRQHELGMVVVDYHSSQRSDTFLRQRNAIDVRRPTLPLGRTRSVMTGVYGILDIVPDPPEAPADVGRPSPVQLEVGLTLNIEPRAQLGPLRWPRLGFGYRFAGDFSGWRIVVGAPF
jgi:hypothetical protein